MKQRIFPIPGARLHAPFPLGFSASSAAVLFALGALWLALSGCAVSPPPPPHCQGTARLPVNVERGAPIEASDTSGGATPSDRAPTLTARGTHGCS